MDSKVTIKGRHYTARVFDSGGKRLTVRIDCDGNWAGDGYYTPGHRIVDCPAVFGDARETENVYLALEMAMPVENTPSYPEYRF